MGASLVLATVIRIASKHLHNDLARAIEALEQKMFLHNSLCKENSVPRPGEGQGDGRKKKTDLGKPNRGYIPPQNATLMQRALEEWERTVCQNKAVAILDQLQEGRPALIQEDGGAMLIAIVLDKLPKARSLVDNPEAFLQEITQLLADKKKHPILQRMLRTIQDDTAKEATGSASSTGGQKRIDDDQFQ